MFNDVVKSCVIRYKDTNLKAIHNSLSLELISCTSCAIRCKDTNLKAIHNTFEGMSALTQAVSSDTKIQI